jgi:hypothetical protein
MSFGWSAGDIVAALKLLHQIGVALKDSGGASSDFQDTCSFLQTLSRTLQHLDALQYTALKPSATEHLREQCDQIRVPLELFLRDVKGRFEKSIGRNSTRNAIFATPRKIQWALSTSKKLKKLQDRVTVPLAVVSIILGQQIMFVYLCIPHSLRLLTCISQTSLQMPTEIQGRLTSVISDVVDTKITPDTALVHRRLDDFLSIQANSTEMLASTIRNTEKSMVAQVDALIVKNLPHRDNETTHAIELSRREGHAQSASLLGKLGQVDASIEAIRGTLENISSAQSDKSLVMTNPNVKMAIRNMLSSIWHLLSSLQCVIRELLYVDTSLFGSN